MPLEEWFVDGEQVRGVLPGRAEYLAGLLALDDAALVARCGAPAVGMGAWAKRAAERPADAAARGDASAAAPPAGPMPRRRRGTVAGDGSQADGLGSAGPRRRARGAEVGPGAWPRGTAPKRGPSEDWWELLEEGALLTQGGKPAHDRCGSDEAV